MDIIALVSFFPEFHENCVGKETVCGEISCNEKEFFAAQLDFSILPDKFGFGVADVSLKTKLDIGIDNSFVFYMNGNPVAYCRIV